MIDQGGLWPLILSVPLTTDGSDRDPASLQKLLIAWRNQPARHALWCSATLPELLPVQVNRFDDSGCKVHRAIRWSNAVYVPVFTGPSLQTTSQRYLVTSVVYHLGPTRLQGHYRAALADNGQLCHVTDDNQPSDVDRGDIRSLLGEAASTSDGFQPFKLESVQQEIDVQAGRLRNRLSLAPWPGKLPLPPPLGTLLSDLQDAEVVLSLDHRFEAYGDIRLRIVLERLDRSLRRRNGEELQGLPSWLPLESSYGFPQLLGELGPGRFDTTLLQGDVRISRGVGRFKELRIFRRLRE
eukprot:s12_g20.t1